MIRIFHLIIIQLVFMDFGEIFENKNILLLPNFKITIAKMWQKAYLCRNHMI